MRLCLTVFVILTILPCFVAQSEESATAYMQPVSSDIIQLELNIGEGCVGRVAVLDGAFVRVSSTDRQLAISPMHRGGEEYEVMILEIIEKGESKEAMRQLERIDGLFIGLQVRAENAPLAIRVLGRSLGGPYEKMPMSCDRCCIYCDGWRICACAVATQCGKCCCSDCCEEWPPSA